jgi:hypothetical protein
MFMMPMMPSTPRRRSLRPRSVKGGSVLLVMIALCAYAPAAYGQIDNRLALGGSVTTRVASSSGAGNGADVGFEIRIGHETAGWGWQYSFFGWFDTDVHYEPVRGQTADLGQLRIRPIMAGYGYTWTRGRSTITADLVGGYAFNSFHIDSVAMSDYESRLGARNLDTEATNTFVIKPEVQVWYDLSPRFGLKLNGGYLVARPSVTVKSSLGDEIRDVKADTFLITVGLVYSIF